MFLAQFSHSASHSTDHSADDIGSNINSHYVGAEQCIQCHQQQVELWQQSDHFRSMQTANEHAVLGDFSNKSVNFHGIDSRFFIEQQQYKVETTDISGKQQVFLVRYTFGHRPLQQYLLDIGGGKLQAFNIAWDNREKEAGGQRWFHLQATENISPNHPFFWAGFFQNWNSNCAECHSTHLKKNYDAISNHYDTQWSDINVACEACHGPGSEHIALATAGKLGKGHSGLIHSANNSPWVFQPGDKIARPTTLSNDSEINRCGGCHSRRMRVAKTEANKPYHDQYRLQLLNQNIYFSDGQIQDEVFVLGSFLQSKMYQRGVRCSHCHDPHSGKTLLKDNALCGQCHLLAEYEKTQHHQHKPGSTGSACVDCHMPERTYMGIDRRRDHSFVIPRYSDNNPIACRQCHSDKNDQWLKKNLPTQLITESHWSASHQQARTVNSDAVKPIAQLANSPSLSPIAKATLIEQLANFPSRISVKTAQQALRNKDPLIRRAAVSSLVFLPAAQRWPLLKPLLKDSSRSVRFETAASLADIFQQLPNTEFPAVHQLLQEYRRSLALSLDSPSGRLALANLEILSGNPDAADHHFQAALDISPGFVPALLNYAEFIRQRDGDIAAAPLLLKALQIATDSAASHHAYGLLLIRQQQTQQAIKHLQQAATLATAQPHFAFVYAIALDSTGNTDKALSVLVAADQRWPNQLNILMTLFRYAEKMNRNNWALPYLNKLSILAPNHPQVQRWLSSSTAKY